MRYVDREWEDFRYYDGPLKDQPFCKVEFTKTGRNCYRRKGHSGVHAYRGNDQVVTWKSEKEPKP